MTIIEARRIDQAKLEELLAVGMEQAVERGLPTLVSHTERVLWIDTVAFFERGREYADSAFFWEQASKEFAIIGVGVAYTIESQGVDRFAQTARTWHKLLDNAVIDGLDTMPGTGPTLLGGFSFDPARPTTPLWHDYPDGSLVLPRLQLMIKGGAAFLTLNVLVDAHTDTTSAAHDMALLYAGLTQPRPPRSMDALIGETLHLADVLPADEWKALVQTTAGVIKAGAFEKVALARAVQVSAARPLDIGRALDRLRNTYPTAYVFAVARGTRCFIGATPERLVGLRGGIVEATGLAGTTARGTTEAEDARLGDDLLRSAKNLHEHAVVIAMLRAALANVCFDVHAPAAPALLKLSNLQHLYTPVSGRIRGDRTLLDLVAQLHPTPAVGGLPSAPALAHLRDYEKLDRGWYAGPVGWLDARGEGDFAVAIRSALVEGNQATLFAGCGIVADSDPASELAESRLKLRPMLSALGE